MMYCEEELKRRAGATVARMVVARRLAAGGVPASARVMPAVRAWIDHLVESFNACGERLL
jgi:hypothetical protein